METEKPYWAEQANIAPIASQYVLWDIVNSGKERKAALKNAPIATQDDAAEAATGPALDDEAEGRPAKKQKTDHRGEAKETRKEKAKRKKNKGEGLKGSDGLCQNTARGRECVKVDEPRGCKLSHDLKAYLATKEADVTIPTEEQLDNYSSSQTDISHYTPSCPAFAALGLCPQGFKCRHLSSHILTVEEGSGSLGTNAQLAFDEAKMRQTCLTVLHGDQTQVDAMSIQDLRTMIYTTKGELNVVPTLQQRHYRGKRAEAYPLSVAYFEGIGETWQKAEDYGSSGRGRGGKRGGRGGKRGGKQGKSDRAEEKKEEESKPAQDAVVESHTKVLKDDSAQGEDALTKTEGQTAEAEDELVMHPSIMGLQEEPAQIDSKVDTTTSVENTKPIEEGTDDTTKNSAKPDRIIAPREKKRLDFRDKLYLAPLTTTGNLPFRRLCVDYGADVTCSEMAVASEFITGNPSEWSLVRRHPSEKTYGVQLCGSRPHQLIPAAEAVLGACPDVDFIDINCGCPIDLVFNKGAGSALLDHANKLGNSLAGLNQVIGETPLTVKLRMGVRDNNPVAHKLIPRLSKEWGVGAATLHGRSRNQRYTRQADYEYIASCVKALRLTEEENDLQRMPLLGNGDAYDQGIYWDTIEKSGVDAIMVARGALIKPWIFTELKERRNWDISARERLDGIASLARKGVEHWGADSSGIATTRRFMCEALSFQHRYIPIGILEHMPVTMTDRPMPYRGRNDLETLLASDQPSDWIKLTEMFLGRDDQFEFTPKHKSNSYTNSGDRDGYTMG